MSYPSPPPLVSVSRRRKCSNALIHALLGLLSAGALLAQGDLAERVLAARQRTTVELVGGDRPLQTTIAVDSQGRVLIRALAMQQDGELEQHLSAVLARVQE